MLGGKANSGTAPTALGVMLSASTYGATIPRIIGTTRVPLLLTWLQNLRAGSPNKKLMAVLGQSTGGKKKGKKTPDYNAAVDCLLGHNPIIGVLQSWINQAKVPLAFASVYAGAYPPTSYVISDPHFYSVVGVTWTVSYDVTFNDYGGPGSQTLTGTMEYPLWNQYLNGPDPTDSSGYRQWPYVYKWGPADGSAVYFPAGGSAGDWPTGVTAVTIYYAKLEKQTYYESPAALMRFTFESSLGNGSEYGTKYAGQRIIYPMYAGLGSPNFDLGPGAQLSPTSFETQGSYCLYSQGDADFADMIEDTVKSGTTQADNASAYNSGPFQVGTSCFDYPGPVQKVYVTHFEGLGNPTHSTFPQPNVAGNILLCFWVGSQGGAVTGITSDSGETWNTIDSGSDDIWRWILAYTVSGGYAAGNRVFPQMGGNYGYNNQFLIMELPVDTFDTSATGTVSGSTPIGSIQLTTSNVRANPAVVMSFVVGINVPGSPTVYDPRWKSLMSLYYASFAQWRTLWAPGTVGANDVWGTGGTDVKRVILASFKQVAPASYPKAYNTIVGNILDDPSLNLVRTQDRAYGLIGSVNMGTQKSAADWCKQFYSSANAWPAWEGFSLKSIPLAEASAVGNGAIYTSPTASGPVANLSTQNGDFVADKDNPPISIDRKAQVDAPNILQYQTPNRSSDYNQTVTSEPMPAGVALEGVRKESPEVHEEIQSTAVARSLLGIQSRVNLYLRNGPKFKTTAKWGLLGVGDLITIFDHRCMPAPIPVRIKSTEEAEDHSIAMESEPFIYGVRTPDALIGPTVTANTPDYYVVPQSVNTPIIFEPVPRLYSNANQPQLWCVVSCPDPNYGGCAVLLSTDGGSSYNQVGTLTGSATTGYLLDDWPAANDPDTATNLYVDLSESLGTLASYAAADRDNFTYPCYVAGGGSYSIPYELMTYNVAVMTAANEYELMATGTGNELRRGVFGAPAMAIGVDHPGPVSSPVTLGSRFAFLANPALAAPTGIFKLAMDPKWIGTTLYFKFLAFNTLGAGVQSQADATAYTFTPTGSPSGGVLTNSQYTQSPAIALTQPTGTHIAMAQVTETFGTNQVTYNARTLTISNPSVPTTYYVTIADPGYVGDTGSGTNLTAYCEATTAKVGVPGYTFIGFIVAVNGGGSGATAGPGGWPEPQSAIVTS